MMTAGMVAENSFGSRCGLDAQELGADGDAAIGADLDLGAHAPDKRPPGAVGFGAQHGTFFFEGEVPGFLRGHFKFAVDLVLVAVLTQSLDVRIGLVQVGNLLAGEVSRQALLPIEVASLYLSLGLRRGGEAEGDAVEMEGLTQLGEGFGVMGKEKAVEVDVEFQGPTVLDKSGRQEITIRQEEFAFIDLGTGKDPTAIIEHIEHRKGLGAAGEPTVRRGIELPEFANLTALPAPDRSGGAVVGLGVSQLVLDGPAPDLSSVDSELTLAEHFAGGKAVGSRRLAAQSLAQQRLHFGRPVRSMIASRSLGRPSRLIVVSTGFEVIAVKFVKAAAGKAELFSGYLGLELLSSERRQHVTD